jgi:hypothetical protein
MRMKLTSFGSCGEECNITLSAVDLFHQWHGVMNNRARKKRSVTREFKAHGPGPGGRRGPMQLTVTGPNG